MRDFFIRGLEVIVNIVMILVLLGIVAAAAFVATGGLPPQDTLGAPPLVAAGVVLVTGLIGAVFLGGTLFLGLGIYQNTRRTAELLETRLALLERRGDTAAATKPADPV